MLLYDCCMAGRGGVSETVLLCTWMLQVLQRIYVRPGIYVSLVRYNTSIVELVVDAKVLLLHRLNSLTSPKPKPSSTGMGLLSVTSTSVDPPPEHAAKQ